MYTTFTFTARSGDDYTTHDAILWSKILLY